MGLLTAMRMSVLSPIVYVDNQDLEQRWSMDC